MILHPERVRMRTQSRLLDYSIIRRPGLDFHSVGQPLECLVMRTVHRRESMYRVGAVSERLDILPFEIVVTGNIDVQSPAHRNIQHLQAAADGQNRLSRSEQLASSIELPPIARAIGVDNQR